MHSPTQGAADQTVHTWLQAKQLLASNRTLCILSRILQLVVLDTCHCPRDWPGSRGTVQLRLPPENSRSILAPQKPSHQAWPLKHCTCGAEQNMDLHTEAAFPSGKLAPIDPHMNSGGNAAPQHATSQLLAHQQPVPLCPL